MADKITFELTKKEFRTLLDMIYAGNMMLSGVDENDEERYNSLESLAFSKAKEINKEEFAEYNKEYGGFLPTKAFEDDGVLERMQAYDDYTFWSELAHRLALRDVATKMTNTTDPDLLYEAIIDRTDEYEEFFEKHDLSKLFVKDMPEFSKTAKTFRSMDIGKIEASDDECCDDDCDCHDGECHCHDDNCDCHKH